MNITLKLSQADKLSAKEQSALDQLNQECFGDVPQESINEDFIAKEFAFIFAYIDDSIVGRLALFKREITFDGKTILLGGMGGVCVTSKMRHHGIATMMLKHGLKLLSDEKCDIACLNVDLDKKVYGVYEKLGFTMMDREITFENIHGRIVHDTGTMFVPVCSPEIYHLVMDSSETFHYGYGYW